MLKIKDNVDLKELEKYGFKILYDENTGQPKELFKQYYGWFYEKRTKISFKKRFVLGLSYKKKSIWLNNFYKYNTNDLDLWQDTLYDLIKDGLVEKVD
jgi:hypothetical protein